MDIEKQIRDDFDNAGGFDALVADLKSLSRNVEGDMMGPGEDCPSIDCRLRWHDGQFYFLTGDASYDQDHRGFWGASSVGQNMDADDCLSVAKDLLDQVIEEAYAAQ